MKLKNVFKFFVARTAFSPHFGQAWLADFAEPADWAELWTKDRLRDKNPNPILKFLHNRYSFLKVWPESEI